MDEQAAIAAGMGETADAQILFGDLHVHTTNSTDAFLWSLPIYGGEARILWRMRVIMRGIVQPLIFGPLPIMQNSTPKRWADAKQSIRACSAISDNGDGEPDMVSYVGFEWTQVGQRPEDHFGHENVIFESLEDTELAKRPIASGGVTVNALRTNGKALVPIGLAALDFSNRQNYYDIRTYLDEAASVPLCDPSLPIEQLSEGCFKLPIRRASW